MPPGIKRYQGGLSFRTVFLILARVTGAALMCLIPFATGGFAQRVAALLRRPKRVVVGL